MSSNYQFTGGGLKLKGKANKITKKSKKKKQTQQPLEYVADNANKDISSPSTSNNNDQTKVFKTKAELKFQQVQEERLKEKIAEAAKKSHKEKVAEFNLKLENLSEHYDIPKVGPG